MAASVRKEKTRNSRFNDQKRQEFTLKDISPKSYAQEQFFLAFHESPHVAGYGSAGTGKSYVALALALKEVFASRKNDIKIIRSAVPTREQGFLPGTLQEKEAVYQLPYADIVNDLCNNGNAYEVLTKKEKINFITSSYVRGRTFDNSILIIDEFQSMTQEELYSVLTRVGENTKVIIIGDTKQCDLNSRKETSGFEWFMRIADKMKSQFELVEFLPQDIVRSDFVRELILANETY